MKKQKSKNKRRTMRERMSKVIYGCVIKINLNAHEPVQQPNALSISPGTILAAKEASFLGRGQSAEKAVNEALTRFYEFVASDGLSAGCRDEFSPPPPPLKAVRPQPKPTEEEGSNGDGA